MLPENYIFETQLRCYATLYYILGILENELRLRVVITLSNHALEKGYAEWFTILVQDKKCAKSIRQVTNNSMNYRGGIAGKLTFGFWTRLFVGRNYSLLWTPALHQVFPALERPLELQSFHRVCTNMFRANQIRNRIAHYEFYETLEFEQEKSVLMWLLDRMYGSEKKAS